MAVKDRFARVKLRRRRLSAHLQARSSDLPLIPVNTVARKAFGNSI
jgi:hypothetical protein